jgi:hypothetical protein
MTNIITKLAGVTYGDARENIRTFGCRDIGSYALVREPDNEHDPNAISVQVGGKFMGYIPKETAQHLAPMMDAGRKFIAYFHSRNESPYHQTVGLTVRVVELDDQENAGPVAA